MAATVRITVVNIFMGRPNAGVIMLSGQFILKGVFPLLMEVEKCGFAG